MSVTAEQRPASAAPGLTLPWWRQVRWRLALFFVVLVVIPIAVIVTLAFVRARVTAEEQAINQLESVAELKTQVIDHWLDDSAAALNILLSGEPRRNQFNALVVSDNPTGTAAHDALMFILQDAARDYRDIEEFYFYDAVEGRILISSDRDRVGQVVSAEPYFEPSKTGDYLQPPYYDEDGEPVLVVSRTVVNREADVVGVLAARLAPEAMTRIMQERAGLGDTGETYLVSAANRALLVGSETVADVQTDAFHSEGIDAALDGNDGSGAYVNYRGDEVFGVYRWLPHLGAALVAEIEQSEALAGYNAAQRTVLVLTAILALVAAGAGIWVATLFTRPMSALAETATRFAGGDLSVRATGMPNNELGHLASVFNNMADQVQELVRSLESRVQERTQDLFLTLEVGQMASRIYRLDDLLPRITDFIRAQFDLYYTQVYLTDDVGRYAVLQSGTGEVGQQLLAHGHRLDLRETSIVARSVQSKRPVLVSDTEKSEIFMPNPLLPETRSEVAIPLVVGDDVIGVLDMQAREAETFHAENLAVFEAMANQLAAAINSAKAHAEMEAAVERATAINRRLTAEAWEGYLARSGRGGRIGYAYDLHEIKPLEAPSGTPDEAMRSGNGRGKEMKRPVSIGGELIGQITLADDGERAWSDEDRALVDDVAHQVAQALEQFRAFDETQTSQRLLRTIIDTSPDWIFAKDTAYRYLLVNRAFAEYYGGLTPEEMQGLDDYELGTPVELIEGDPEQGIVGFRVDDRKVVEHGETVFNPNDVVQFADGSRHIFETTKLPLRNARGDIIGVLGVARDVTEAREAEAERERLLLDTEDQARRLALLNQMATEISVAEDLNEVYSIVARYTDRVLHSQRASVALLNAEGTHFDIMGLDGTEGAIPAGTSLPVKGTYIGTVLQSREVQVVPDMRELDYPETKELAGQGLVASMSVPLVVGEDVIGLLNVATTEADAYDSRDQGILVQIGSLLASSIETYRLLAVTQRRAVEMETVAQVSTEASTALEVENLLWSVVELTKEQFGLYHAHIYLLGESGDTLVLRAGAGEAGQRMVSAGHRITLAHGASLVARAARTGETVRVDDVTASPDFLPNPLLPLTRSEMAVPMIVGEQLVGVLDVQSDQMRGFTDIDHQVYSALAAQIAVAVNNARLFAETQRRAVELETVAQVSAEASTTLDPERLLWDVSELVKARFDLYHAHVYLLDESGERLRLAAGAGEAGRMMVSLKHAIPVERALSVVARAARTREAVVENDVTQAEEFLANPLLPDTRAEMAVPMIVGEQLVGVLDVQSDRRGFTEADRQIYSTLAAQIAVAVNNARLFAEQVAVAEQLREVDRLKSEFLASMSHELRTPLNSIIGYAEVLLDGIDGDLTADMEEDVSAIHGSGKHLLNLINDILDLAKIEAGQMDLVTEALPLRPLVEDMISTTRVLVKNKPVELVVDVPEDLPPVVADPLRVRQVVSNLLSNASKFTEEGSITVWAEPYDRDPAMIHVGVTDTGIGMSAEQAAVIFDRFRQVDQSHTRRAGGTGLGLSITRQLIELHNGDIWVESEPGVGSTFHFTLPVATAEDGDA